MCPPRARLTPSRTDRSQWHQFFRYRLTVRSPALRRIARSPPSPPPMSRRRTPCRRLAPAPPCAGLARCSACMPWQPCPRRSPRALPRPGSLTRGSRLATLGVTADASLLLPFVAAPARSPHLPRAPRRRGRRVRHRVCGRRVSAPTRAVGRCAHRHHPRGCDAYLSAGAKRRRRVAHRLSVLACSLLGLFSPRNHGQPCK